MYKTVAQVDFEFDRAVYVLSGLQSAHRREARLPSFPHSAPRPFQTPTDVHAPLPVLSSMSKAEAVALLTKVHAAEAEVPPMEEWDLEAGVERSLQLEPEDIVPHNVLQLVEEQCGYAVAVEREEAAEPLVA